MNTFRAPLAIAVMGLSTLAATACGSSSSDDGGAKGKAAGSNETVTATTSAGATSSSSRLSSAGRAVKTAGKKVSHGRPYDVERDRYKGKQVWEIKVAAGKGRPTELDVSANGRKVVRRSRHKRDDDVAKALKAKVSLAKALRTAGKRAKGRFSEGEIDRKGGKIVWTASFKQSGGAEKEVIIDARTGKVIKTKTEDDDD